MTRGKKSANSRKVSRNRKTKAFAEEATKRRRIIVDAVVVTQLTDGKICDPVKKFAE